MFSLALFSSARLPLALIALIWFFERYTFLSWLLIFKNYTSIYKLCSVNLLWDTTRVFTLLFFKMLFSSTLKSSSSIPIFTSFIISTDYGSCRSSR